MLCNLFPVRNPKDSLSCTKLYIWLTVGGASLHEVDVLCAPQGSLVEHLLAEKDMFEKERCYLSCELLICGCMHWSTIRPWGYLPASFRNPEIFLLCWICRTAGCSVAVLEPWRTLHARFESCQCRGLVGMKIPPKYMHYGNAMHS